MNSTTAELNCENTPALPNAFVGSLTKWFVWSGGVILAVTGAGKVFSAFDGSQGLNSLDPIFLLPLRQLLIADGVVELVVATVCFATTNRTLGLGLIAWLATNLAVYRLGAHLTAWSPPCDCCLGSIGRSLGISPQTASSITLAALACMLAGSFSLLLLVRASRLGRSPLRTKTSVASGCLAFMILWPQVSSAAEAFEVTGTVWNKAYAPDGREFTNQMTRFVAAVDGAKWHIREIHTDTHWVEYGCDGTNIFQILHYLSTPEWAASRVRQGLIMPGTYPATASWGAGLAWVEYGSAARLSGQEIEPLLAPWLSATHDARTYALKANVQLSEAEPRVPAKVRFVTDADRLKTALEGPWLLATLVRLDPSKRQEQLLRNLEPGSPAGEIEVLSWTNVGALVLPRSFKATHRAFADPGLPGGWIFAEYYGEAEKIEIAPPRESYLPDISGFEVTVGDFRLRDRSVNLDNIRYRITDGMWTVNVNESHRAEFERLKRAFSRSYRQPSVNRKVVLTLLLITLLAPFLFVVWKRTRKATATT